MVFSGALQITWLVSIMVVSGFLLVQMLFLHYRIDDIQKKHLELLRMTQTGMQREPAVQMHACMVQRKMTDFVNDASTYDASDIEMMKNILGRKPVTVPYVLKEKEESFIESYPVVFDKFFILFLQDTTGSQQFFTRVANDTINYVLIGQNVYYVRKDDEMESLVRNRLQQDQDADIYKHAYHDSLVLFLHPMLNHHIMDDRSSRIQRVFNVTPFLGQFHRDMRTSLFVSPEAVFKTRSSTHDIIPMHMLAYKA